MGREYGQEQAQHMAFADSKAQNSTGGTSLVVQWLGLCTSTAGGAGSIPGRELRSRMPAPQG